MVSRFVVHHHKTGRPHFDLRLIQNDLLRCWSLLKEPPQVKGERRLAVERESFPPDALHASRFAEDAFGPGRVYTWDEGGVELESESPRLLVLTFMGQKLTGRYELRQMRWYPGNRWLLGKAS